MDDIRNAIFRSIEDIRYRAVIIPERDGILSGLNVCKALAKEIGVSFESEVDDGDAIKAGTPIITITGSPIQIAVAEEKLMGAIAKASGIASAAKKAVSLTRGKAKVVSGSSKKMPPEDKSMIRCAVKDGGADFRIAEPPFLYLDKNYIRMFGSISASLDSLPSEAGIRKVIQIRGITSDIASETQEAWEHGASIFMVDTGDIHQFDSCRNKLQEMGVLSQVKVAFSGEVKIDQIPELLPHGVDLFCIGKEIVDAPIVDMKLDVTGRVN